MNCPIVPQRQAKNRPGKRRWAIGRSAAQIASAPLTSVQEPRSTFWNIPPGIVNLMLIAELFPLNSERKWGIDPNAARKSRH